MEKNVLLVAGARPNFMKIAPLYRASLKFPAFRCRIVHTGQHYDFEMSQTFFEELEIPQPHFFLHAGSGSHAIQTARIMTGFEEICFHHHPDLVMVVGDVNSTLACSLAAKKLGIEVAHVEAGLRSFDRSMPEEINRLATDSISDYFLVTEPSGMNNLLCEGQEVERILYAGNVMIDNLFHQIKKLDRWDADSFASAQLKKFLPEYLFMTLHRPSNVDSRETFAGILEAIAELAAERPVFFPIHPRTRSQMEAFDLPVPDRVFLMPPLGYMESLYLWKDAAAVITDSGGLQEETTALGVPCVTVRENTERPVTVDCGTNVLAGTSREGILAAFHRSIENRRTDYRAPDKWDGRASERIWEFLAEKMVTGQSIEKEAV